MATNTQEAGRSYYATSYALGWLECARCVEEKYDPAWIKEATPLLTEGEEVAEGLRRCKMPLDACISCETCGRAACLSIVCGACGFAPGCKEHHEGHHATCPEGGKS
jgi:hypothetical protein